MTTMAFAVSVALACLTLGAWAPTAALPAHDEGEVAATITVPPVQEQTRKRIRVVAVVEAHEPLSVTTRGTAWAGGEMYALRAQPIPWYMDRGESFEFRFSKERRDAKGLFRAIKQGRRPLVQLLFRIRSSEDVVETESEHVRLTR